LINQAFFGNFLSLESYNIVFLACSEVEVKEVVNFHIGSHSKCFDFGTRQEIGTETEVYNFDKVMEVVKKFSLLSGNHIFFFGISIIPKISGK